MHMYNYYLSVKKNKALPLNSKRKHQNKLFDISFVIQSFLILTVLQCGTVLPTRLLGIVNHLGHCYWIICHWIIVKLKIWESNNGDIFSKRILKHRKDKTISEISQNEYIMFKKMEHCKHSRAPELPWRLKGHSPLIYIFVHAYKSELNRIIFKIYSFSLYLLWNFVHELRLWENNHLT